MLRETVKQVHRFWIPARDNLTTGSLSGVWCTMETSWRLNHRGLEWRREFHIFFYQLLFNRCSPISNPTPAAFQFALLFVFIKPFQALGMSIINFSNKERRRDGGKRIKKIAISATSSSREISAHYPRRSTSRCSPFIQLNILKKNLLKTRTWSIIQINFNWRPKMFCSLVENRCRRRAS